MLRVALHMSTTDVNPSTIDRPAQWAQPGMGTPLHHQFFYWLMRLGGMARGYHMANIASAWYVLFYPSIRKRCSYYLKRRFPGQNRSFLNSFRLVRAYATTLVDIKVRAMFGPGKINVDFPDRHRLADLTSKPTGFVLVHAHVGCWQVAMSTLGHFQKHVSVVMIPDLHTMSMFDPKAVSIIDPRNGLESALQMTDALLNGNILVLMGDRTIGSEKSVVPVHFLGGDVMFPITPYRMASALGVPVAVMTAPRTGKRAYELQLATLIEVPPGLGRNAINYTPYAQQFADCIEQFTQQNPWQFYNFFNLWTV